MRTWKRLIPPVDHPQQKPVLMLKKASEEQSGSKMSLSNTPRFNDLKYGTAKPYPKSRRLEFSKNLLETLFQNDSGYKKL